MTALGKGAALLICCLSSRCCVGAVRLRSICSRRGFRDPRRNFFAARRGRRASAVEDRSREDGPQSNGRHPTKLHVGRLLVLVGFHAMEGLVPRARGANETLLVYPSNGNGGEHEQKTKELISGR